MVNRNALDVIIKWCEEYKDDHTHDRRVYDLEAIPSFDWDLLVWDGAAMRSDEQVLDIIDAATYLQLHGLSTTAKCVRDKLQRDKDVPLSDNVNPTGYES